MKNFPSLFLTCILSIIICFLMFAAIGGYLFLPERSTEKVQNNISDVPYSALQKPIETTVLISIEDCPLLFWVDISTNRKNLSVTYLPNTLAETTATDALKQATQNSIGQKPDKVICFSRFGFEATVNFLNGILIDTPYGLPSPSGGSVKIPATEKQKVFGASLSTLLTEDAQPSYERMDYYGYVIGELCLKFLTECDTEAYKFLKQNSHTDISYTDFYDNYKLLKSNIKYAVFTSPDKK